MNGQIFFIWHILSELQTLLYTETSSLEEQFDELTFLDEIPEPLPCCTLALIDILKARTGHGHENHAQEGHELMPYVLGHEISCLSMIGHEI